jgi:hypothetical protein
VSIESDGGSRGSAIRRSTGVEQCGRRGEWLHAEKEERPTCRGGSPGRVAAHREALPGRGLCVGEGRRGRASIHREETH